MAQPDRQVVPQPVLSPLTSAAIFLVATIDPGGEPAARELLSDLPALQRAVGFRVPQLSLSCVVGIGSHAWDRLFGGPRPAELHPFRELTGAVHRAPSTPGDLLFHLRAGRLDPCFELASQIMDRLRGSVTVCDEVHGFKYFDVRDLLGFVDGTENPVGPAAGAAVLIGDEDPGFAGGSYVVVQKYLHDLQAWNALPVEAQERVIGRTKLSDIELDDAVQPPDSHVARTTIVDPMGPSGRSCGTTCRSAPSGGVSSAPTSSATPAPRRSPSGCWSGCSSGIGTRATTGSWSSPPP